MVDKLYHRANPCSSLRPIVCLVVEIQHIVCNRATPPIIEKLLSEGVAMHVYGVSACILRVTYKSIKWTCSIFTFISNGSAQVHLIDFRVTVVCGNAIRVHSNAFRP